MHRITCPTEGFTGPGPGDLHFVDGVGETDSLAIVGYCQGAGYRVERLDDTAADDPPDSGPDTPTAPAPQADEPAGRSRTRTRKASG